MESIKGSEVNVPDAVFAWVFDGQGGARPLEDQDHIDSEHPCWLHLNYTHPDSAEWLAAIAQQRSGCAGGRKSQTPRQPDG